MIYTEKKETIRYERAESEGKIGKERNKKKDEKRVKKKCLNVKGGQTEVKVALRCEIWECG
jgi:hypothetical protein